MSYDKIYIPHTAKPGGWLERSHAEKSNLGDQFKDMFDRLYAQGHYVTLAAGRNCIIDELFLFRDAVTAKEFYDRGFVAWERFPVGEDEGLGFDSIRLYDSASLVAAKSSSPSKQRSGHSGESDAEFEKAAEFMANE